MNGKDEDLHPQLFELLGKLDKVEPWKTSNCAEVQAVNHALEAGLKLTELLIGTTKQLCNQCNSWLEKIPDRSFYRVKKAKIVSG